MSDRLCDSQHKAERRSTVTVDVAAELAQHQRWLRTVLAARGVEYAALDEVMQEVATSAVRGVDRLRDPSKVAPWLYRIAATQAVLYRRSAGRRRKLVSDYAESGFSGTEAIEADPLAWLMAEEQQQLVRTAVGRLAPRDAELLLLKYTEDWSYRELACRLGASVSAVEARLHRARAKLRRELAKLSVESASLA